MRWLEGYRMNLKTNLLNLLTPDYVSPPFPTVHHINLTLECEISIQELVFSQSDTACRSTLRGRSCSMFFHVPQKTHYNY